MDQSWLVIVQLRFSSVFATSAGQVRDYLVLHERCLLAKCWILERNFAENFVAICQGGLAGIYEVPIA